MFHARIAPGPLPQPALEVREVPEALAHLPMAAQFPPALTWVECEAGTAPGDLWDGQRFTPPAPPTPCAPAPAPTLDGLRAQLAAIQAHIQAMGAA